MASVLGFDYGARRIGIAIGVVDIKTANPLDTLLVPSSGIPWDKITSIIEDWQPASLVVGCVEHATQNDNAIQKQIAGFCDQLKTRYQLPVEMVDESNTSVKAYEILKDLRGKGRKKINKTDNDKASATLILNSWYETKAS